MRRSLTALTLVTVAVLVAATAVLAAPPAKPRTFTAPLSGSEEVLNGVVGIETQARGVAIFRLSPDGSELSYRLIASNIENVMMAHIHCCAPAGANAGVVVWLYPEDGPPPETIDGRHSGPLATGTITSDDVIGMSLAELVEEILAGKAYVNVHTQQFPGGEIRGQLP